MGDPRRTIEAVILELEHEQGRWGEVELGEGEVADGGIGDLVFTFGR